MSRRKQRIATAFGAAADDYDNVAAVQRQVAERLAARVSALPLSGGQCVEIGCGTGFLSRRLIERLPGDWLITDLAAAMVDKAATLVGPAARFQAMDGEAPSMPPESCALIVSSLAFQWFEDLPRALRRLSHCLKPGGHLAFATLGSETFVEWRQAHAELGLACGTPAFPDAAALQAMWPEGGSGVVQRERIAATYESGRVFIRSLKQLGAHVAAADHAPLAAGAFRRLLQRFDDGCTVSYDVLYGVFTKGGRQ